MLNQILKFSLLKRHSSRFHFWGGVFFLSLLSLSCQATATLTLKADDKSGKLSLSIEPKASLQTMINDYSELSGGQIEDLFNEEKMKAGLETNDHFSSPSVSIQKGASPSDIKKISLTAGVVDLNRLSDQQEGTPFFIQRKRGDGKREVLIRLNQENLKELNGLSPDMQNPLLDVLGPINNAGLPEEEYDELVRYTLEDKGLTDLNNSSLILNIVTPSDIQTVSGGKKTQNRTARFSIPLKEVILLNNPIQWQVVY